MLLIAVDNDVETVLQPLSSVVCTINWINPEDIGAKDQTLNIGGLKA